jgi:hypothetical protein
VFEQSVEVAQKLTYGSVDDYNETNILAAIYKALGVGEADVVIDRTDFRIKVSYDFSALTPPVENVTEAKIAIAQQLGVPLSRVVVTPKRRLLTTLGRRLATKFDAEVVTPDKSEASSIQANAKDAEKLAQAVSDATGNTVNASDVVVPVAETEITLVTKVTPPAGGKTIGELRTAVSTDLKAEVEAKVGTKATVADPTSTVITGSPTATPTSSPTQDPTTPSPTTPSPTAAGGGSTSAPTAANTTAGPAAPTAESDSAQCLAVQFFLLLIVAAVNVAV